MINLCLVVIATQFSETKRRETERMAAERLCRRLRRSSSTLASSSADDEVPDGCYAELVRYAAHIIRRSKRHFVNRLRRSSTCACIFRYMQRRRTPEAVKNVRRRARSHRDIHQKRKRKESWALTSDGACVFECPYIVRSAVVRSSTAPRASPELSDIDPLASPRLPTPSQTVVGNSLLTGDSVQSASTANGDDSQMPAEHNIHPNTAVAATNCRKTSFSHVIQQDDYDAAGILRASVKKGYRIIIHIFIGTHSILIALSFLWTFNS